MTGTLVALSAATCKVSNNANTNSGQRLSLNDDVADFLQTLRLRLTILKTHG